MRIASRIFVAALLCAAFAGPARAGLPYPEWNLAIGGSTAILGDVSERGVSAALSALWRVDDSERIVFGASLLADDLGSRAFAPVDTSTGATLGLEEQRHRAVYGAAWRLDLRPWEDRAWRPFASGTWGWSRVRDDVRGRTLADVSSAGFTLAGGVRHSIRTHATAGLVVRYHRLFNDRVGRYMSAGMEWSWR